MQSLVFVEILLNFEPTGVINLDPVLALNVPMYRSIEVSRVTISIKAIPWHPEFLAY